MDPAQWNRDWLRVSMASLHSPAPTKELEVLTPESSWTVREPDGLLGLLGALATLRCTRQPGRTTPPEAEAPGQAHLKLLANFQARTHLV